MQTLEPTEVHSEATFVLNLEVEKHFQEVRPALRYAD
jgi:hypothetical protein